MNKRTDSASFTSAPAEKQRCGKRKRTGWTSAAPEQQRCGKRKRNVSVDCTSEQKEKRNVGVCSLKYAGCLRRRSGTQKTNGYSSCCCCCCKTHSCVEAQKKKRGSVAASGCLRRRSAAQKMNGYSCCCCCQTLTCSDCLWRRSGAQKMNGCETQEEQTKRKGPAAAPDNVDDGEPVLPDGVFKDLILPRLDVRTMFGLRASSKLFREMPLQDMALSSSSQKLQREESWLILFKLPPSHCTLDDKPFYGDSDPLPWNLEAVSLLDKTQKQPFQLPGGACGRNVVGCWTVSGLHNPAYVPSISGAANGLLCAYVDRSHNNNRCRSPRQCKSMPFPTVLVFNCLTRSSQLLDPPPFPLQFRAAQEHGNSAGRRLMMAPNHEASSADASAPPAYYILFLHGVARRASVYLYSDWSKLASVQLYDSSLGRWKNIFRSMSSPVPDSSHTILDCDFLTFYFSPSERRNWSTATSSPSEAHILGYRASQDQWFTTTLTRETLDQFFPLDSGMRRNSWELATCFAKHDGRLLMLLQYLTGTGKMVSKTRVVEVCPVSDRCCNLVQISVRPKRVPPLYSLHGGTYTTLPPCSPVLSAGANYFCISDLDHTLLYDLSNRLWYYLQLPDDHRCMAILEPRKTLALRDFNSSGTPKQHPRRPLARS